MAPPKAQEGAHHVFWPTKAPKKLLFFVVHFFWKVNFGPSPKNSGLNPWSFEFWRYHRCGGKTGAAAGSASDDTFHIISLIKNIFRYY